MIKYAIRRILASLPVLFGVLLVTFVLARAIPGDPCKAMLGEKATDDVCEKFNRDRGFDKPILVQFGIYMNELVRREFETEYLATGKRYDVGKSCVRFRKLEDLPLQLIGKAIAAYGVDDFTNQVKQLGSPRKKISSVDARR